MRLDKFVKANQDELGLRPRNISESAVIKGADIKVHTNGRISRGKLLSLNESDRTARVKVIQNSGILVKHVNLSDIEVLNEASVMDTIKSGVQKAYQGVKNVAQNAFNGAKKLFGTVIKFVNGLVVKALGPVGIAANQANGNLPEGVTYYPSDAVIAEASESGISVSSPDVVYNEDPSVSDIENFWMNVMDNTNNTEGPTSEEIEESYKYTLDQRRKYLLESKQMTTREYLKSLNEAVDQGRAEILYSKEGTNIPNVDYDTLVTNIKTQFNNLRAASKAIRARLDRAIQDGQEHFDFREAWKDYVDAGKVMRAAYMIWGAPGIGKTQIVQSILNEFKTDKDPYDVMGLDAMHMQADSFTLPSLTTKKVENEDGSVTEEVVNASDVVKTWLPMFVPTNNPVLDREAIDVADGPTHGGIIFIDEFSRMHPSVANIFMNIIQDRKLNDHILGPGWLVVCAGNRKEDMQSKEFVWDSAWDGRFVQVNYVPSFNQWIDWAKKNHLNKMIIDWISTPEGQQFWYEQVPMNSKRDNRLKADPRTLHHAALALDQAAGGGLSKEEIDKLYPGFSDEELKELGIVTDQQALSTARMYDITSQIIGVRAAKSFREWLLTRKNFTEQDAADLLKKGYEKLDEGLLEDVRRDVQSQINLENYTSTIMTAVMNSNGGKFRALTNDELLKTYKFLEYLSYREDTGHADPALFLNAAEYINQLYVKELGMIPSDDMDDPNNLIGRILSPEFFSGNINGIVKLGDGEGSADIDAESIAQLKEILKDHKAGKLRCVFVFNDIPEDDFDKASEIISKKVGRGAECFLNVNNSINNLYLDLMDPDKYSTDFLFSYRVKNSKEDLLDWISNSMKDEISGGNPDKEEK